MMAVFNDIGAFLGFLIAIFKILMPPFAYNSFILRAIKRLYLVRTKNNKIFHDFGGNHHKYMNEIFESSYNYN